MEIMLKIDKCQKKGFSFVEIMVVAAVIALFAAIVIPNLLRARLKVNEEAAQSTLERISMACERYRAAQRIPSYDPAGPPAPTNMIASTANPPYLEAEIFAITGKQGYVFTYTPITIVGSIIQQYVCGGEPVNVNVTGGRTFAVNETGVLRVIIGKSTIDTQGLYNAMTVVQ